MLSDGHASLSLSPSVALGWRSGCKVKLASLDLNAKAVISARSHVAKRESNLVPPLCATVGNDD